MMNILRRLVCQSFRDKGGALSEKIDIGSLFRGSRYCAYSGDLDAFIANNQPILKLILLYLPPTTGNKMKSFIQSRKLIISIFAVILLTACSNSPEATISNFYQALEKGEITEAKKYLSSQLLGMMGDNKATAALTGLYEKIQKCDGIANIETELSGEGELRSGTTAITFNGNCPVKNEKTKLIKEDGDWKITASK